VSRSILLSGTLLCLPVVFLISAMSAHPIWPAVLGNPALLMAAAVAAIALVLRPFTKLEARERSIHFSVELPPLANIAIATVGLCVVTLVLGYGFVENFTAR
jgi:hypothetical protein